MSNEREGLIGRGGSVHPSETTTEASESLPPEEHVDQGNLEEDLQAPEEKRNATDGYAPADDGFEPTDAEDDLKG
jgi:hypothetical protein